MGYPPGTVPPVTFTLALPRSAVMAAWLGCGGNLDQAIAAIQGDDEPHTVSKDGPVQLLASYLAAQTDVPAAIAPMDTFCMLPVEGDPSVLSKVVATTAAQSGEVILLRGTDGSRALVPVVRQFGTVLEPGHHVIWIARRILDWRRTVLPLTADSNHIQTLVSEQITHARSALQSLDAHNVWPELENQIVELEMADLPVDQLPRSLPPFRLQALELGARMLALVHLVQPKLLGSESDAAADQEALSVHLADQQAAALRDLDQRARNLVATASTYIAPRPR